MSTNQIPDSLRTLSTREYKKFYSTGSDDLVAVLIGDEGSERLHSGNAYSISSLNTNLSSGGTHVLAFSTPDSSGSSVDILPFVQVKGDALLQFYEGATVIQGTGTPRQIHGRNRTTESISQIKDLSSSPQSGYVSNGNVSVSSEGTLLHQETIGLAGISVSMGEWLLKSDTTYVFRVISRSASNRISLDLRFHEK